MTVLTELEQAIVAEGEKVRAAALRGALEVRKSKLVKELEKIEQDLASLLPTSKSKAKSKAVPDPSD